MRIFYDCHNGKDVIEQMEAAGRDMSRYFVLESHGCHNGKLGCRINSLGWYVRFDHPGYFDSDGPIWEDGL